MTLPNRTQPVFTSELGTQSAQPASGRVELQIDFEPRSKLFRLNFTLKGARIPVTDATTSGSSGSLKLFDFNEGGILALACRQDYTKFAEGSALTTAAGDAAFVLGLGSVAADAGDGTLTGTEINFGDKTGTLTNSSGTTTGTKFSSTAAAIDGTGTATDLYLNWSGSAATIDASSTIDVWGTITVIGQLLGDD